VVKEYFNLKRGGNIMTDSKIKKRPKKCINCNMASFATCILCQGSKKGKRKWWYFS